MENFSTHACSSIYLKKDAHGVVQYSGKQIMTMKGRTVLLLLLITYLDVCFSFLCCSRGRKCRICRFPPIRRRNFGFNNRGLFRNQLNQLDRLNQLNQLKQRILLRNLGKTTNRNRNGPRLNLSPEKPKIVPPSPVVKPAISTILGATPHQMKL
eukprot:XP_019929656.1 PREDICTED: uncharacterized protein LOC105345206 [Crassostrea gigas]